MSNASFFEKVYDIVSKIPKGNVATYGQIAFLAGRPHAARVVGYALSKAPTQKNLPCHRVVNIKGAMHPEHVYGNQDFQRLLLEKEGITFLPNGCIDMKKHLWRFESEFENKLQF